MTNAGGVAFYVKSNLDIVYRPDLCFCNINYEFITMEVLNKDVKSKNSIFTVGYRHPKNPIPEFIEHMKDILFKINSDNLPIFMNSDFNIDHAKANFNFI